MDQPDNPGPANPFHDRVTAKTAQLFGHNG